MLKSRGFIGGILAVLLAAFVPVLTGCDNGNGGNNNSTLTPSRVVIGGFATNSYHSANLFVFPVTVSINSLEEFGEAIENNYHVAHGVLSSGHFNMFVAGSTETRWTGAGSFNVFLTAFSSQGVRASSRLMEIIFLNGGAEVNINGFHPAFQEE
jgi:hypothetical protein